MNDLSIHPRNWPGGDRKKRNTCANSSLKQRALKAIVGVERHIENNPNDAAAKQRLSTLKAAASS